jgi:O-antigen/teichoic acid export membrane protein
MTSYASPTVDGPGDAGVPLTPPSPPGVSLAAPVTRVPDAVGPARIGWHAKEAPGDDRLVRSSFFLMATAGAMAGLGFAFSVVVARVFSPEQVGAGTSLIAATTLIAYVGLLGLDGTMVRFIVHSKNFNVQFTQSMLATGGLGLLLSVVYVILVPFYAPTLSFVRDNLLYALGFIIAGAAASANQLTDSVFLGVRRPEYNLLRNGLIQGAAKVVLPFALVSLGAYGVFGAVGVSYVVSLAASAFCLRRIPGFRFEFRRGNSIPKEQQSYSILSYISNSLNIAPVMLLPLITLHTLGSANAAYFYLAFQVANTVNGISYAIGQALFAEGSSNESRLLSLSKRAAVLQGTLQAAAVIVAVLGAPLILSAFGREYATHGQNVLRILAFAAIAVAVSTWATYLLKVLRLMKSLIACNVVFVVVTIGLAQLWGHRGVDWFGWAWFVGQLASGLCAIAALVIYRRRRHVVERAASVRRDGEASRRSAKV